MPEFTAAQFDPLRHEYEGGRLPSVTTVLRLAGLCGDDSSYTEESRVRGTAVHACCHFYAEGDLDMVSVDPQIEGYVRSFASWLDARPVKPAFLERPMKKEPLYAGTSDGIMVVRPRGVYDIKSGPPMPWHSLQTALYVNCLEDPFSYSRFGVYLAKNGSLPRVIEFPKSEYLADLNIGLSAVNIFHWKKSRGLIKGNGD